MKLAGYLRVSTDDQKTDLQRDALERYARTYGHTLVAVYEDVGISGAERRRPQLEALRAELVRRRFEGVIVWKLDRMARSVRHLIEFFEELRGHQLAFISVSENLDTTTPAGMLLFHVIAAIAQFERDLIAERVRAGMAAARSRGATLGRPRRRIDGALVRRLLQEGLSKRAVAARLEIAPSTLRRYLGNGTPGPKSS